jgi:hypothetical protein
VPEKDSFPTSESLFLDWLLLLWHYRAEAVRVLTPFKFCAAFDPCLAG